MSGSTNTTRDFDPVEMEVFSNRLLAITEEMGITLVRSSFSTNIKERKDCSVGIFDAAGRLVCQASHIPLHLGSLAGGVEAVLANFAMEEIEEGDAFVCNDPYIAGGTHLPDISIVTPVFCDGNLAFFVANIGHHTDVGGSTPGSSSHNARSLFEEGIRIPITKIRRRDVRDHRTIELISQNSRDPEERRLDLGVQISTNDRGARLLVDLAKKSGLVTVQGAIDDLLAYTETRLRKRIAELPDGTYTAEAALDNDGIGTDPVPIRATIKVTGDELVIDFAGSGPQALGNLNIPESALRATCYYAVKSMLDPQLPPNGGMMAAVTVTAPEGTITNPAFPAPVAGRSSSCQKVARAVFLAFAEVLPRDRVIAPSTDMNAAMVLSGPRRGSNRQFVYLETVGGGGGATAAADGMHGVQVHITNSTNLPVEAMEIEYPLIVREYGLVESSCGAGMRFGGAGIAREIEAAGEGIVVSVRTDGASTPAPGLYGGDEGGTARVVMNYGRADEKVLPAKIAAVPLPMGQSMRIETPGGGGFGPASERDPAARAADIRDGFAEQTGR